MEDQINEIERLLNNDLPGNGVIFWTIIIGLLVAMVYGLLKRIIIPIIGFGRKAQQWRWRLGIIESLYPPVFGLIVLVSILISKPLIGLVISATAVIILYKPMKNYMLGVIYRSGKTYSIGQRIAINGYKGSIVLFNSLSLEMELEDGSRLDVPYDVFGDAVVVRSSPNSGVLSHTIELAIPKPCDITQVKLSIRTFLLSMPYVLPNQKIGIEHLSDQEHFYQIKVIIYGVDKQQMYDVEGRLKGMFTKGEMKKVG